MNSDEFRKAAHASLDEIINYYETIQERRVLSDVEPGYLRKLLPAAPPEEGEKWEDIQKDIESKIMPGLTHWQSPNFMSFYPSCSTYPSMLGELYSAAFTAPSFNWICSPAVTELETIVMDWLAQLFNLPSAYMSSGEGGGVIHGSASEAIVTVMVAARERYLENATRGLEGEAKQRKKDEVRSRLVALGSRQSHSSTNKAATIAGVRFRDIHTKLEDNLSLTGQELQEMIDQCKKEGLEPFYITTTMGTTNSAAVDRFEEIAEVLKAYPQIWVHVDAAYAGSALVCEEYQHITAPFAHFDSFNVNVHKWLLVNFDASCTFITHRQDLTRALSITRGYYDNSHSTSGLVTDYRDWQIPLGRRFRSLKIWFVLRTYGVSGLKAHIRNTIAIGKIFQELVASRSDLFVIPVEPAFGLTVFTVRPVKKDSQETDDPVEAEKVTKKAYELINAKGKVYLTSGLLNGLFVIRVVSGNEKANEKYVRAAFDIIVESAEEAREP